MLEYVLRHCPNMLCYVLPNMLPYMSPIDAMTPQKVWRKAGSRQIGEGGGGDEAGYGGQ